MKRILFQSDDFGMTDAVSDGIIKGIQYGLIRNTGLFVNMKSSKSTVEKIKNIDVCLGIDINYVCGKPVSDPKDVADLIDKDGFFISSGEQRRRGKLLRVENLISYFEEDPYPYEQILLETENQVKKFIELTGRLPEYLHPHSLCTPNTEKAATEIAQKYGIYHSVDMMNSDQYVCLPGGVQDLKGIGLESQMNVDIVKDLLEIGLPGLNDGETGYYICHCGYADADLFKNSSLTLRRLKDLEAMLDPNVMKYIHDHQIELITYRDLK